MDDGAAEKWIAFYGNRKGEKVVPHEVARSVSSRLKRLMAMSRKLVIHGPNRWQPSRSGKAYWRKLVSNCGIAQFSHSTGTSVRGRTKLGRLANMEGKTVLH